MFIFFLRFVVFRFQESPKYLLYRGKDEKAIKVLHHIAKFNGRESSITMEAFEALNHEELSKASHDTTAPVAIGEPKVLKRSWGERIKLEFARYKILFSTATMARLTVLVWIAYML